MFQQRCGLDNRKLINDSEEQGRFLEKNLGDRGRIYTKRVPILFAFSDQYLKKRSNSLDARMVRSVRLKSCRLWFDFESGQTNDFKLGIHSFPA